MKRLIYEDTNGYCRIVSPLESFRQAWEPEDEALSRLHQYTMPEVVEFLACEEHAIPTDHTFRDAWKKGDKDEPIKIDLDKALSIHRERIKKACDAKIAKLNAEREIAVEDQNLPQQVAIDRTKKILRTLYEMNLTHCKTPEDVKYAIPKELHDVWTLYPPKREAK